MIIIIWWSSSSWWSSLSDWLTACQESEEREDQLRWSETWSGCSSEDLRHQWWNWGLIISLNACRLLPTSALIHIHQPPPMEFTDDRSIRLGHPLIHTAQQDALNLENIDVWDSRGLQTGCLRVFSGFPFWLIWLYFFKKDLIPNVADMPPIRAGVGVLKNIINVWYFSPHIILSQKYTLFRWTHGLTTNTGYFGVY